MMDKCDNHRCHIYTNANPEDTDGHNIDKEST